MNSRNSIFCSTRNETPTHKGPAMTRLHLVKASLALFVSLLFAAAPANAGGDLSRQEPIVVTVELGKPGTHGFFPNKLTFETGKLYKLVMKNPSSDPHYFTSHNFTQMIFTRKVQVVAERDGKPVTLAE